MSKLISSLKQLRAEKGLTQAALGGKVGLPQGHISNIEKGVTDPRLSTFADMVRVLDAELVLVPRERLSEVNALVRGDGGLRPRWRVDDEMGDE